MGNVIAHVWYDANGKILAVGRPLLPPGSRLQAVPHCAEGQFVLETEASEDLLKTMHQTHSVDVKKKVVIKAAAGGKH